jgi:uncharacterized protein
VSAPRDGGGSDVVLRVRLTPRGGRDAVEGVDEEGVLRIRVSTPAVDGAANRALVGLLARTLRVAPSHVVLESGVRSRLKRVRLSWRAGLSPADVEARCQGSGGGG